MTHKLTTLAAVALLTAAIGTGCATHKSLSGLETRVETSGKPLAMVEKGIVHEHDDKAGLHRFVGMATDGVQLDTSINRAEIEARRRLVEAISTDVRAEAMASVSGDDREAVGRFFEQSTSTLADTLPVSGAATTQTYWEKYQREEYGEAKYTYRAYAIVEIPDSDYAKAKADAARGLVDLAQAARNEKAEIAARGVWQRLLDGVR